MSGRTAGASEERRIIMLYETNYLEQMQQSVLPYLGFRRRTGMFECEPGRKIYYEHYHADHARGYVVLMHGFSEVIDKFSETIWDFLNRGYHVWAMDQREHGRSFRMLQDPSIIYIEDSRRLVRDLRMFVKKIVQADPDGRSGERILFGHSMGGGVSACYLEKYPDDFDRAILSSPMLELNTGIPVWAAQAYARLMISLRKGRNAMPGSAPFKDVPDFEGSCTGCRARYDWWFEVMRKYPEFQMCVPAVRTAMELLRLTRIAGDEKNIRTVRAKVLMFQAGKDTMVESNGQNHWMEILGSQGKLVRLENARHEIYRETDEILETYWKEIDQFLNGSGSEDLQ